MGRFFLRPVEDEIGFMIQKIGPEPAKPKISLALVPTFIIGIWHVYTIKDQKYFHKINFSLDFSVFSCSLEIILWHYYSTDCNNFGTGRQLHELCKQYICFILIVHLIPT